MKQPVAAADPARTTGDVFRGQRGKDGLFEPPMSYYRKNGVSRQALQGAVEDYAKTIGGVLTAANEILKDPALPEVTTIVLDIHRLQPKTPSGAPSPGIGLRQVVPPLKAYRYYVQNKWVLPVAIAAIIGVPFFLGYMVGRR